MSNQQAAHAVATSAAAASALLRSMAELIVDDDTAEIIIDTETDLPNAISAALDRIAELEQHREAITARMADLAARKARFGENIDAIKRSIQSALEATSVRKIELPHGREVMLSDTVGFVADLPHDLVAAFRATLEEVVDADIILHVRDIANPDHAAQAQDVLTVLEELGVSSEATPIIEVWNKIDLLEEPGLALASAAPAGKVVATMPVSAHTGVGLDALKLKVEQLLSEQSRTYHVHVPYSAGSDIGWLHNNAEVISRDDGNEQGSDFVVRVDPRHRAEFLERFNGRIAVSDL